MTWQNPIFTMRWRFLINFYDILLLYLKKNDKEETVQEFLTIFSIFEEKDEQKKEKTKCFILLYIVWRYYEPLKSEEKDEEGSRSIFCHDKHSKLSHHRGVKWRWRGIRAVHPPCGRKNKRERKRMREFQSVALPGPAQVRRFEADQCIEFHKNS